MTVALSQALKSLKDLSTQVRCGQINEAGELEKLAVIKDRLSKDLKATGKKEDPKPKEEEEDKKEKKEKK